MVVGELLFKSLYLQLQLAGLPLLHLQLHQLLLRQGQLDVQSAVLLGQPFHLFLRVLVLTSQVFHLPPSSLHHLVAAVVRVYLLVPAAQLLQFRKGLYLVSG